MCIYIIGMQKKRITCNSIMGIRIRVGLIYWSVCSKKNGGVSDIQWDFSNTYNLPTYLAVDDIQCKQRDREGQVFSTIFLILKKGGEFGRIKRTGPLSPILSLLVPGDFYRGNSATRTINQLGSKLVGHILWWDTRYFLGLHLELVAAAAARSAYRVLPSYWTFIKMIKAKKLLFVSLADSTVNF